MGLLERDGRRPSARSSLLGPSEKDLGHITQILSHALRWRIPVSRDRQSEEEKSPAEKDEVGARWRKTLSVLLDAWKFLNVGRKCEIEFLFFLKSEWMVISSV